MNGTRARMRTREMRRTIRRERRQLQPPSQLERAPTSAFYEAMRGIVAGAGPLRAQDNTCL
jgi:hypothetical protein